MPSKKEVAPLHPLKDGLSPKAYRQAFRHRLIEMREEARLTQEQLCELVGIPVANYKHMEGSRASAFPPHKLEKLSWALRKSCHYIITGRDWRGATDEQNRHAA